MMSFSDGQAYILFGQLVFFLANGASIGCTAWEPSEFENLRILAALQCHHFLGHNYIMNGFGITSH